MDEMKEREGGNDNCLRQRAIKKSDKIQGIMSNNEEVMKSDEMEKSNDLWHLSFELLPTWLQDNEHLRHFHRPQLPSVKACLISAFRLHTETANIWTHLLGSLCFLLCAIFFYLRPFCSICDDSHTKLVFTAFFLGAILCLFFSAAFHTLSCHSAQVAKSLAALDYAGIALLIMGSSIPWIYYAFYCHFYAKLMYMGAVLAIGMAVVVFVVCDDYFLGAENRAFRALFFVALAAAAAVVPTAHYVCEHGWRRAFSDELALHSVLAMGALYVVGATLYAVRIPERLRPGTFDVFGHSHQIFHMFVLAAAFTHYNGIYQMAIYRLVHFEGCDNIDYSKQDDQSMLYRQLEELAISVNN